MVEQTKKGEKFLKARQWLKDNPRVASRLLNWQKMRGPTLYKALSLSGVVWDTGRKCWRETEKARSVELPSMQVNPARKVDNSYTVSIRIIADTNKANIAIAGLLEMARALDWVLIRNSKPKKGLYGDTRIAYFVFGLPGI